MRTFEQLMKNPDSPLTKEELNNWDTIMFGGRTDDLPHEEFDYDPISGMEVPPAFGKYAFLMELSRHPDERTRKRAIECRWRLAERRLCQIINERIREIKEKGIWI